MQDDFEEKEVPQRKKTTMTSHVCDLLSYIMTQLFHGSNDEALADTS